MSGLSPKHTRIDPLYQAVYSGSIRSLGKPNAIRIVRLEDYYREDRHSPDLIRAIAFSLIVPPDLRGSSDWSMLRVVYPYMDLTDMALLVEANPTSFSDYLVIDCSILSSSDNNLFLSTRSKLRSDLLIEIEAIIARAL